MKKFVVIVTILAFLVFPLITNAEAVTFGDLLDELEAFEKQRREENEQKQLTQAEFDRTSKEIVSIENEITSLNKRIEEATEEIAKLEKEIISKQEEIDRTLTFLQISSGEKSYLEYVFKAKSFTDFIHRISIVEQLSKNNKNLIKEMNDLIKKNNDLKDKLAKDIKEEEKKRGELKDKLASLGSKIEEIDEIVIDIDKDIASAKETIKTYEDLGCTKREDVLTVCAKGMPTATGFIRPITKGVVTSDYGYRTHPVTGAVQSFHSGIDMSLSNAEGTSVYAAAPGVVASRIYRSSCGGNILFIHHNVNGYRYTTVYMHLLSFNDDYKPGAVVTANSEIGKMGGWSTSTSHGGYDKCTTGAHLHFTMATGFRTAVDYRSYLIDPDTKVYFPNGWWYSRTW